MLRLATFLALAAVASTSARSSCNPSSRLLFSPDLASHSYNQLAPSGEPTSHYEGTSVCYTTEHGTSSAGCALFSRVAVDTRRANAAARHPAFE